jgi:hypothetical protein
MLNRNTNSLSASLALEEAMYVCAGDLTPFWMGCIGRYGCDCAECIAEDVAAAYYHFYRGARDLEYYTLDEDTALEVAFERGDTDHLRDLEYWDWDAARDARKVANDEKAAYLAAA